jgi:hypothetical protein
LYLNSHSTYLRSRDFPLGPTTPHHPESTNEHNVRLHSCDLPTAPIPKVKETQTQDHLREKVTHLNLADYPYDLETIAKETGELGNLKINYVMNYENVSHYELH